MPTIRNITKIIIGQPVSDGAGVKLTRIFGFYEEGLFDPFLLLDFFGSDNPADYRAGFPWHPHRGMETVTYMLHGRVEHGDSLGNRGVIGPGDLQWMTAGSGIIHQEMPVAEGKMYGFQLWVNLPASQKMTVPRYQDIPAGKVPEVKTNEGAVLQVLAGVFNGIRGPVEGIVADPLYLDVELPAMTDFSIPVHEEYTVFAYVFEGEATFGTERTILRKGQGGLFGSGSALNVATEKGPGRFILIAGKPIREPVAWRGPIVMNTEAELTQAFREYRDGTFVKKL